MAYPTSEIIILNGDEFFLMLTAAGVESWYGPALRGEDTEPMDMETANRTLASLYQKGLVDWNGDKVKIAEDLKEILKVIRSSKICITMRSDQRLNNASVCFANDGNVVVVDTGIGANLSFELSILKVAEWIKGLEGSGYFPKTPGIPLKDEEEPSASEDFISEFLLRSNPDGRLLQSVALYEKGLFGLISLKTEQATEREYFSRDRIEEILKGWIGG